MRVTNAMQMENWLAIFRQTSQRLERAQVTLASGKSLQKPSDHPAGTAKSIILQEQISREERYLAGINEGSAWLKTADSILGTVANSLSAANEIALLGANGVMTGVQRKELAEQVGQIIEQSVEMANAQHAGDYIFAGEKINVKPFEINSTKTGINAYAGGSGNISRQVQGDTTVNINYSGQEVFVDTKVFDSLFNLKQALEGNDVPEIQNSIKELQGAFNQVVSVRGMVGSKISWLGETKELHEQQKFQLGNLLGEIEEGNIEEVITALKREETAYQAALLVGARINSLSLLDFLR